MPGPKYGYNLFIIIFVLLLLILQYAQDGKGALSASGSARRIVSLSPSLTDQVIDLGASSNLAGVTTFCPAYSGDAVVVGTYVKPDMEKIISLQPDMVLVSDEDSIQPSVVATRFGLRCFRTGRVSCFDDICSVYLEIAGLLGKSDSGRQKVNAYRARLTAVERPLNAPRIVFLVSARPLITVSGRSYISSIIKSAGGLNLFESGTSAYPILSLESLLLSDPDAVITMNAGDLDYLRGVLEVYRDARFVRNENLFLTGDGSIPYYSPARYVESVEKFASIFAEIRK